MTFISYAQNFEDVILWRALKHVECGFYIDVGAQDPVIDSVSLAFYEHGWRGVHIEPDAEYAEKLRLARPDEDVVQTAVGREAGEILFFEIPDTGLSTGDEEIAKKHEAEGRTVRRIGMPCLRLANILDAREGRPIHWLKIDVEGMEDAVIDGWSPSKVRPWIVVVESTMPNSPEQSHMAWEPKLLKLGYYFVYFDGLNRFYVSAEHPELKTSFGPGPNYFDYFTLTGASPFCQVINAELSRLRAQLAEITEGRAAAGIAEAESARDGLAREVDEARRATAGLESNFAAVMEKALTAQAAEAAESRTRIDAAPREARARREVDEARRARAAVLESNFAAVMEKALTAQAAEAAESRARLEAALREARTAFAETNAVLEATRKELRDVHQSNHHQGQLAEARAAEIAELRGSTSWRLTAPLRGVSRAIRWFLKGPRWVVRGGWAWLTLKSGSRPRLLARKLLQKLARFVLARPDLSYWARRVFHRLPAGVRERLRAIAFQVAPQPISSPSGAAAAEGPEPAALSARAREIHTMLQTALERQNWEAT